MIRSGTTCLNDMYMCPDEAAKVVDEVGIRAMIGLMGRDDDGTQTSVGMSRRADL